jgi:hypothetical protein
VTVIEAADDDGRGRAEGLGVGHGGLSKGTWRAAMRARIVAGLGVLAERDHAGIATLWLIVSFRFIIGSALSVITSFCFFVGSALAVLLLGAPLVMIGSALSVIISFCFFVGSGLTVGGFTPLRAGRCLRRQPRPRRRCFRFGSSGGSPNLQLGFGFQQQLTTWPKLANPASALLST